MRQSPFTVVRRQKAMPRERCAAQNKKGPALRSLDIFWGGRWGSNPRQLESQSRTLPLSYGRHLKRFKQLKTGAPDRTRTCYPRLRRPVLYPDELRARKKVLCQTERRLVVQAMGSTICIGRGERIRTFDILVPNQARYRAALRPEALNYSHILKSMRAVTSRKHAKAAQRLRITTPQAPRHAPLVRQQQHSLWSATQGQ